MIAVFHRQWKSFAHSFYFYGFLTAFFFGLGALITIFHVSFQYANFEYTLSYLTIVLALLLPLMTVFSFHEERRGDEARFVQMLPISARNFLCGKLLAMLTVLLLLTVFLLLIPIFLGLWGTVYYPSAYMAIFGFLLCGAAILSLDSFLALIFKNFWVALGVSYAVTGAMVVISYFSSALPMPWGRLLAKLSLFSTYAPFVFGIVDLYAIGLYLSVSVLFAALSLLLARKLWRE
ncbi:MAG: hypothetical protein J6Q82_04820 [Clostridia bacterium]|nr:hypothetical protein [Clostridia bacterium]